MGARSRANEGAQHLVLRFVKIIVTVNTGDVGKKKSTSHKLPKGEMANRQIKGPNKTRDGEQELSTDRHETEHGRKDIQLRKTENVVHGVAGNLAPMALLA